jgi:hypothetical protein
MQNFSYFMALCKVGSVFSHQVTNIIIKGCGARVSFMAHPYAYIQHYHYAKIRPINFTKIWLMVYEVHESSLLVWNEVDFIMGQYGWKSEFPANF